MQLCIPSNLWLSQGWNKKWDEWVEAEGLTKYKKELAKVEFTKEGEGGTREFGGKAEAAEGNGRSRAEGGRKPDKGHKQGAVVSSKASTLLDAFSQKSMLLGYPDQQSVLPHQSLTYIPAGEGAAFSSTKTKTPGRLGANTERVNCATAKKTKRQ